ncbi:MAG TPA: hypothetical protein VFQ79_19785 [Bryobacteraceae bacterium]|nr:hypothetical protein [Bryobacteraceae bacterium]
MEQPNDKRKPNRQGNPLYGLNRRVARKLGKSESMVSQVRRGIAVSSKVAAAIEDEARLMLMECAQSRRAQGGSRA